MVSQNEITNFFFILYIFCTITVSLGVQKCYSTASLISRILIDTEVLINLINVGDETL